MIPDINLLPKVERGQSNSKVFFLVLGICTLLILSFLVWQYFSAKSDLVSLKKEEQTLIAERDNLQSQFVGQNNENAEGSLEQSVEYVELVSYPVSPLIDETIELQPENSYLRSYSFTATSVDITLDFETLSDISDYVSKLSNSSYFSDVQVGSISNFDLDPQNETDTENENAEEEFYEQKRYSVNISLMIDEAYLATGGVQ